MEESWHTKHVVDRERRDHYTKLCADTGKSTGNEVASVRMVQDSVLLVVGLVTNNMGNREGLRGSLLML